VYLLARIQNMNDDTTERAFNGTGPGFGLMGSGLDVMAVLVCFVSVGYLFGFFGIQYV